MAKVRYTGSADERILSSHDLAGLGIVEDGVSWNISNHHTAEMSDEAARTLVELLPDEFRVLDRDDEVPVEPDGSSSSSESEEKSAIA